MCKYEKEIKPVESVLSRLGMEIEVYYCKTIERKWVDLRAL